MSKKSRNSNAQETALDAQESGDATAQKPVESKADKFRRLANRRIPKAVKAVQYCRNLATRGQYEYSDQQAATLIDYLQEAVNEVKAAFNGAKPSTVQGDIF